MYISHMHLAAISPNACIDYYLRFTKIDAYFYMSDFSRCFNTLTHHMTYSSANTNNRKSSTSFRNSTSLKHIESVSHNTVLNRYFTLQIQRQIRQYHRQLYPFFQVRGSASDAPYFVQLLHGRTWVVKNSAFCFCSSALQSVRGSGITLMLPPPVVMHLRAFWWNRSDTLSNNTRAKSRSC